MVEDILWLKVSDEVGIPGLISSLEAQRLMAVFSAEKNSPWSEAARALGMKAPECPLLQVFEGVPYFNASALSKTVSNGSVVPTKGANNEILYQSKFSLVALLRSVRTQWLLESFLQTDERKIASDQEKIRFSVALGLALQALLLRLPGRTEQEFARWLADPESAPKSSRATLKKILRLQNIRTSLSPAWKSLWDETKDRAHNLHSPDHFWNSYPVSPREKHVEVPSQKSFKGIPISPGEVRGTLVLIDKIPFNTPNPLPSFPRVLVFSRAHPDSTLLFPEATAVVFAEGGALAHACCVAREQGIPCVSGVGKAFLAACKAAGNSQIRISGSTGEVEIISG